MQVKDGDVIEIPSNKVEVPARRGTVERVIELDPLRVQIRWENDRVTVLQPHGGTFHVVKSSR